MATKVWALPMLAFMSNFLQSSFAFTDSRANAASIADTTPLQKLVTMLQDMVAKGAKEKQDEAMEFAKFQMWCDGTRKRKEKSIKNGAEKIEQLTADIAKAKSDAERLSSEVQDIEKGNAGDESELNDLTAVRKKEEKAYMAQHKELAESVDATQTAIQDFKAKPAGASASLLQLNSSKVMPMREKAVIESFLAMGSDEISGAPAPAYKSQTGAVTDMLAKLESKFKGKMMDLEKAEMSSKGNYMKLVGQLTNNLKAAKETIQKKTAQKARNLEEAAEAKGDKATAKKVKADDETTLADLNTECDAKAQEYEKNQVIRADEVKAIQTALKILQSSYVKGTAETYLPSAALIQTSFAQLRSRISTDPTVQRRLADFLQERAKTLGSKYLSTVAARAGEDPLIKVKKMIKDLIVKLSEEANSEADHHAYCESELATNKLTRDNKGSEIEELTAEIDELSALSSELSSDVSTLADDIADLRSQQAESTQIRDEEKKTNEKTIAEAKQAGTAVAMATKVLKDYYARAAEASLLQNNGTIGQQMSEASVAPYKGMQSESGGIFGLLEVVHSDFQRLTTETSTSEYQAAAEYEKFMDESDTSIALKETEKKHKEEKKARKDQRVTELTKEKELTQGELDAAVEYYDKLKSDCVDKKQSYEERVEARKMEIQSLQEAVTILRNGAI